MHFKSLVPDPDKTVLECPGSSSAESLQLKQMVWKPKSLPPKLIIGLRF